METIPYVRSGESSDPQQQTLSEAEILQVRTRACQSCRSMKVRCLPDPSAQSLDCRRCAKAMRKCIFIRPNKKKLRESTANRVSNLEKQLKIVRSISSSGIDSDAPSSWRNIEAQEAVSAFDSSVGDRKTPSWTSSSPHVNYGGLPPTQQDVVDRGLLSMSTATTLFEAYVQQNAQECPIVVLPQGTMVNNIRHNKPILFLAILTATSGASDPDLYHALSIEISQLLANKVVANGEKTLELVQAILVAVLWNYPAEEFTSLKFYQWIHIAAAMALDIGLDRTGLASSRLSSNTDGAVDGKFLGKRTDTWEEFNREVECRRTFLVCYLFCAG